MTTTPTKKTKLISLLRDRRWHSVNEVQRAAGYRYSARIKELRDQGSEIRMKRDEKVPSRYWYRYAGRVRATQATGVR
jgi:hypothetical protein